MSYINDKEVQILASGYNLAPPRAVYPARRRAVDPGKYEPDRNEFQSSRVVALAHFGDRTNILIRYNPGDLVPPE